VGEKVGSDSSESESLNWIWILELKMESNGRTLLEGRNITKERPKSNYFSVVYISRCRREAAEVDTEMKEECE
jgi:hypothetical protein